MTKELRMLECRKIACGFQAVFVIIILLGVVVFSAVAAEADTPGDAELAKLLETMRAVDKKGVGNEEAAKAWPRLAECNAKQLPAILAGMDHANPLAANWMRTAIETIYRRELAAACGSKGFLPSKELERFVLNTSHAPHARRLAYEWLISQDPSARERIIPKMLDDACLEMRRDAVARLIKQAEAAKDNKTKAIQTYKKALAAAREEDQVKQITRQLKKLGIEINLPRYFGFIVNWQTAAPFDNTDGKGYNAVYGPEEQNDFSDAKKWKGKHGEVKVFDLAGEGDHARIDFNKAYGEKKSVIAYARARFVSDSSRQVQFRLTTHNAFKVWLNGKFVCGYQTYHDGGQFDHYICDATLQKGENIILVKSCQNALKQEWTRAWDFSLRVCDKLGGAILSTDRK
ncbi:MAG: hypothetical protein JXM70_10270 [Pirellulales bacterium]|nr:hypothetical protein [Pirellulales bacterium]